MNDPHDPNEAALRTLLRATRPDPSLPPRFREGVWRRLEHGESPDGPFAWLEIWTERLLRPRFAAAGLALLLLAGAWTGIVTGNHAAKQQAQARYLAAVAPGIAH